MSQYLNKYTEFKFCDIKCGTDVSFTAGTIPCPKKRPMDALHELVNVRKLHKSYTLVVRQGTVHDSKSKIATHRFHTELYELLYR